ncbi:acyl carrier protein [Micromonospora sp. NPDC006766]|uniref:acyl carrier protein n=1 Tax=Micromonospora sp. NPDC006766 TaxID=3154778 RepID=UPI0033EEF369
MWDAKFEETLRQFVPFLDDDEPLAPDTSLRDLGLDSMGIIEMMAVLEAEYEVRFRDDMLNMQTFATPGALWGGVSKMVETVS